MTYIEQCIRTFVVSVKLHDGCDGGPIRLYITNNYEGGTIRQGHYSYFINKARRFLTKEDADQFIEDYGIIGGMVTDSIRTVATATV